MDAMRFINLLMPARLQDGARARRSDFTERGGRITQGALRNLRIF